MICTISSRTSPLPPGNWCEARKMISSAAAVPAKPTSSAALTAPSVKSFLIDNSSPICIARSGYFYSNAGARSGSSRSRQGQSSPTGTNAGSGGNIPLCCTAGGGSRISLAQHFLLHLAHGVSRQFVDKKHALGLLELGEPVGERGEDLRLREIGRLFAHDDGGDALAEVGMRQADHGRFDHAFDRIDLGLDLLRIDVIAAGNHEILGAAGDVHIAALVDHADVAGDEEAIVAEFGFGFFRHPPITLEYVGPAHFDDADFAW